METPTGSEIKSRLEQSGGIDFNCKLDTFDIKKDSSSVVNSKLEFSDDNSLLETSDGDKPTQNKKIKGEIDLSYILYFCFEGWNLNSVNRERVD